MEHVTLLDSLDFQSQALGLRSERQRLIASNIANADTPGYIARDLDFAKTLKAATGGAVHSTLPAGVGYTSLDLSVKFLRGMTAGTGRALCEGRVVHRGRRTALAEATLRDPEGRLLATASSTCLIFDLPS